MLGVTRFQLAYRQVNESPQRVKDTMNADLKYPARLARNCRSNLSLNYYLSTLTSDAVVFIALGEYLFGPSIDLVSSRFFN